MTTSTSLTAEIVTTGTEILLGEIVDTNAPWIAQQLRDAGVSIYFKTTVGDNEERLRAVLEVGLGRSDVIILTGGLGPTVDDVTRQAVAAATNRPLQLDEGALDQLRKRFERFGSTMSENNKQQAMIPSGARLIPNPVGTAPGFIAERDNSYIIALPGVPSEMKRLMQETVIPWLHERAGNVVIRRRILRTIGIGESSIDDIFNDLMRQSNPTMGLAAHTGQCDVRITARADGAEAAEAMLDEMEETVRARIGRYIYSTTPGESYETVIARRLQERSLTVAILETNTGGAVAKRIEDALEDDAPLALRLVAPSADLPADFASLFSESANERKETVRAAADLLTAHSGAPINVAIVGSTGETEGVYGATSGETWIAMRYTSETFTARVPYGGTDSFTTVRIGNHVLSMINDAVDNLHSQKAGVQ